MAFRGQCPRDVLRFWIALIRARRKQGPTRALHNRRVLLTDFTFTRAAAGAAAGAAVHVMRRALRELARGAGRADAWCAASAAQTRVFTLERRGVASLADWSSAGARRLQPLLQPRGTSLHSSLLPSSALAVSLHARWRSTDVPPQLPPPVPETLTAEPLVDGGSEVATIAGESMLPIASLQYLVEWFHVSCALPWCVAPSCVLVHAPHNVTWVSHRWLAIAASTWTLRTMIMPLAVLQVRNTANMTVRMVLASKPAFVAQKHAQLARPEMERLQTRMKTQVRRCDNSYAFFSEALFGGHSCPDGGHPRRRRVPARTRRRMAKVRASAAFYCRAHARRLQIRLPSGEVGCAFAGARTPLHLLVSGHQAHGAAAVLRNRRRGVVHKSCCS